MSLKTKTTSIDLPVPKIGFDEVEERRLRAASQIQDQEIQSIDSENLSRLKALAGHGDQLNIWMTPSKWLVHGLRIKSIESVDLRGAALSGLTGEERSVLNLQQLEEADAIPVDRLTLAHVVEGTVLQAARYLLLLRLAPSALVKKRSAVGSLKPTVLSSTASGPICRMVAIVTRKRIDLLGRGALTLDDPLYFSLIKAADLAVLPKTYAKSCGTELRRMSQLCGRELWRDAPLHERYLGETVNPELPPVAVEPEQPRTPHLPLPDDYVAQMGQRCLWIIDHLGPTLLMVAEQLLTMWRESAVRGNLSKNTRKQILIKVMKLHFPSTTAGTTAVIESCPVPPFPIKLSTHGEISGQRFKSQSKTQPQDDDDVDEDLEAVTWPPHNVAHFIGLCGLVQGAHFFVASLATATRQSESMDLLRDCVVYGKDGQWRTVGRTFKLVQAFDGEVREWELPEVSARAIEQQARLVRLLEQMPWTEDLSALLDPKFTSFEGRHLWCRLGTGQTDARKLPRDPNKFLRKLARTLNMETKPGGQPMRTHRFRKTIARLAALAIDEAPLMLKHLFGHKDIEMTLHYILADKALAAEVEQVIKELHMMRAKAPVEAFVSRLAGAEARGQYADENEIDYAGYGGKAVARIADTVQLYREQAQASGRMRNSAEDFGADHIDDVVRILTGDGTYFNLVRPGVICTKRLGEWGPCSRKKGRADRSNCQESCDHRLEEPWLRADADSCIVDALAGYERASADGEVLLQSFWIDQVRRNVTRFEDLRTKWFQHPTIAKIMALTAPLVAAES